MFRSRPQVSALNCLVALGAVLFTLPSSPCTAQKSQTHPSPIAHTSANDAASIRVALEAYEEGRLAVAEPLLQELLTAHPNDYRLNAALGGLLAEAGETARAIPLLERSCRVAPREALAHANLGAAYLKVSRNSEAVRELGRAMRLDPDNPVTLANLGQAQMAAGKPQEAAKAFSRAADRVAVNSTAANAPHTDDELRYNAAVAYLQSGLAAEALRELKKIPPASMTDAMHALAGELSEKGGDPKQAVTEYQAAAQMNPSDENLYALTAELLRHWTWTQAVEIAEFGATRYPASKHFKVAAGVGRYANNDYKGAVPLFAGLLQAEPENAMYADLLGRSCSLMTDGDDADCSGMHAFALRHPENAVTTTYAAAAILHQPTGKQDLAEAGRLLRSAIAADAKYAEAYFQMGVLEQAELHWGESADMLERSITLRPASSQAHYRLSRAYAHLGRREEAQAQMNLQQQLSQAEKDSLNARLQEVVTFVLKPN